MGKRAAVGATVASTVIFSVLLASSLSVYYAANENYRLHEVSNAADAIADGSVAFEGAGGASVLLREQALLSAHVLDCTSAFATLSRDIGGLTDTQASANLTVVTTASLTSQGQASDNLSMLAPFGGYVGGVVDTTLHEDMRGASASLGVSFAKNETHYVHLGVKLGEMASDCNSALSDIEAAVSATMSPECTTSAVSSVIADAVKESSSQAASSGLRLAFRSVLVGTAPCSVDVTVEVSQARIVGPAGNFNVELRGGTLAVFGS
jgi:hypothetical protein